MFENLIVPVEITFDPSLEIVVDVKWFVNIDECSLPGLIFLFFIDKTKELK
jgi:hypothetical protein